MWMEIHTKDIYGNPFLRPLTLFLNLDFACIDYKTYFGRKLFVEWCLTGVEVISCLKKYRNREFGGGLGERK